MQAKAAERQQGDLRMQAREDLTNVQFSILIRKEKRPHVCDLILHWWNISQSDIHFG